MGLTFDLYTHTDTQNHWDVTQQVFRRHSANEYIYQEVQKQWFDAEAGRFWPTAMWKGVALSAALLRPAATNVTTAAAFMMRWS